jgi:transcriptional regulator with XRE-family HTH domain
MDLQTLLTQRGLSQEAAGVIGEVDPSTIYRIITGEVRARPSTIVRLARGLGVGARRMQAMCDAHWLQAHPDEVLQPRSQAARKQPSCPAV